MKFAVATKTRFNQYKVNTDKFRTTPQGAKVMSLKKLNKINSKAQNDSGTKIYEHTDPEFVRVLNGGD